MPVAPVDKSGVELFFEDTGAPGDGSYQTIVIIHGTGIHGAIFHPILQYAKPLNLRVVLVNRRDYRGSTALSNDELDLLRPPNTTPETQAAFLRARGLEVAEFLAWFARTERIPSIEQGGGLSVVGWSSANGLLLAMFANLDAVPQETLEAVEPYLHTFIHFDGPRWTLGYAWLDCFPRRFANTLHMSEDERFDAFKEWVAPYYAHPYLTTSSYNRDPSTDLTTDIATNPAPEKVSTFDRMTREEQESVSARFALFGSEGLVRNVLPGVWKRNMRKALFGEGLEEMQWKRVKVVFLQCSESLWETTSAMWEVEEVYENKQRDGDTRGRKMQFHLMKEANHMPMWDQPERLTKLLAECVQS
ncbi:hypothetical protein BV25DRAFT_1820041 [Artomyces pyxidatus]|uniref:Uncharacterized protein n=1 Tax=Artomyces pyxidatus TaxID=48021 RepID=A0ACB8TEU4_9AGAM|nr:hypothetical protein BV25DRAFT_1820041 [Artomyces pyxidatus]